MRKIQLSAGKQISVTTLSELLDLDHSVVLENLQILTRDHYRRFGTQAIQLFFDALEGYSIRNTSVVGILRCDYFSLELLPKINKLETGKCLGLAQVSGMKGFQIADEKLMDLALTIDKDVSLIDYFGYSLLDSVIHISHNGFLGRKQENITEPNKIGSNILINETLVSGKNFNKPFVSDSVVSHNIQPNQIIKSALKVCLENSSETSIQDLSALLLNYFEGVNLLTPNDILSLSDTSSRYTPTAPRPDYEVALSHALAILEGGSIEMNEGKLSAPSFTLDLDKVFESFCSKQMKNLMNREKYVVETQRSFAHVMSPNLSDKKIVPDVLIKNIKNNKGVILDLKNKYSSLREDGKTFISNPDIYQISYYAKTLGVRDCVLVYPAYKPRIQYPLKASEGEESYNLKKSQKMQEILTSSSTKIFLDESVRIIIYNIDLSGSVRNSVKSVAGLCQLVADIMV
jgi:5-methylcytosine-specific restriction endonuclease McrBC regulatory subunit McrC